MVEISEDTAVNRPQTDLVLSKSLREVTHEDNERRIKASVKVLQSVRAAQNSKQALTRMVRGTGATMTNSKIGFYTLLCGYLKESGDSVTCTEIFELMDKELKTTAKANTRETADAYVGRVLTITAMIRQNLLNSVTTEQLKQCVQVIVETTKLKAYHSKLAYNALIALLHSEIPEGLIKAALVPVLKKDLNLTWAEQTMSSVHFLIELRWKFPKLASEKSLKDCFVSSEILTTDTFDDLFRIFWNEQNESSIMQPSYEALAKYAATSKTVVKFARYLANKLQTANTRNKEVITVKVMTEIVNNLPKLDEISKILGTAFWTVVFQSAKKVKTTDEILRAVYLEFFEAVYNVITKAEKTLQFTLIRTLLMSPGTINVDKFPVTNRIVTRSINVLNEEVLCQLTDLLQNIITEKETKGENGDQQWLYTEKVTALGYLQKILHNKKVGIEQKTKSLHWLATYGLFEDAESTVNAELAEQIKRLFFKTLESPFIKINEEKVLLQDLIAFVEKHKKGGAALRQPLDKANQKMWTEVLKETNKKDATENQIMFHVLLLHMSLQLFNDPELASNAIKELHSCMQRATTTSLRRKTKRTEEEGEPEWTEVMVDLILHLLSQNSAILRNVVKKVFPNICAQLNLSAVHQILSLLDMNEENPLLEQENGEEGEEEEAAEDAEMESGSEDDDDEDEEDEDMEDNDHDASVSDQMRNAISMALMADHKNNDEDDDKDSIDLDTMTEEEGQRLDEALANAFKLMGKRTGSGKTKTEKMETTALLHFRNRVVDLLIIYLKSGPEFVVVVEILSVLYRMLDHFSDDDAAEMALFAKVQEAIDVAVGTKIPAEIKGLSTADAVNYLRTFITKCANPKGIEERSVALQKIVRFFTQIDEHLPVEGGKKKKGAPVADTITDVLSEELKSFLTQRTPVMGLNIFQHILQGTWKGIWQQLDVILEHGTVKENRVFKRAQSLDLLRTFQKNIRFLKSADVKEAEKYAAKVHKMLQSYKGLVEGGKMTPKEFRAYIQLLWDVRTFHNKNPTIKSHLDWAVLQRDVKVLRESVVLDQQCQVTYAQLCKSAGWEVVKDAKAAATNGHAKVTNGKANGAGDNDEEDGEEETAEESKPGKKRKGNDVNANLKEKKLKKEKRFKMASSGLDETIHFTNMQS